MVGGVTISVQGSLLDWLIDVPDDDPARPRLADLGRARRTHLGAGAWVDVLPGWVSGSAEVFDRLLSEVPWHGEQRQMYERVVSVPRMLSWYGEGDALPHPLLVQARDALSAHYRPELGEPFRTAGLCLYRDGRDSVAWHGDTIGRSRYHDTMVAIVSFWWCWVAPANAPGSTPCPRRLARSVRGSACSCARAGCGDRCRGPALRGHQPERDTVA